MTRATGEAPKAPRSERVRAPTALHIPSARHQLTWRALEEKDQAQFNSLMAQARQPIEGTDIALPPYHLTISPGPDGDPTTLAGFDQAGVLRAAAALQVWPPANDGNILTHGAVDQDWSGRGIGRSLMAWEEGRARQILSRLTGSGPVSLWAYVSQADAGRRRLLMAAGFAPARSCYWMRRDLQAPIEAAALPEGYEWSDLNQVTSHAVMRAANQAPMTGWWTPGPIYAALWAERWKDYRPEWSQLVIESATGQVVAFSLVLPRTQVRAGQDRAEALIDRFGVLPEHQGPGIGQALLARTLTTIAASSQRFVVLNVDPDRDPDGAAMAEVHGFSPAGRVIVYALEL